MGPLMILQVDLQRKCLLARRAGKRLDAGMRQLMVLEEDVL